MARDLSATSCPLCDGSDRPLFGRLNHSLSILTGDVHMLVDVGAGCHFGIRRANLNPPAVIFATHSHPDHLNEMELNTVIRDCEMAGRPKPMLVATERTWQDISKFHQHPLDFVEIAAGNNVSLQVCGQVVRADAIDASHHWRGGLNFIISVAGFRLGALFDRKSWDGVHDVAGGLDLAVLEANSIYRMAEKTGHVSLSESLAFCARCRGHPVCRC